MKKVKTMKTSCSVSPHIASQANVRRIMLDVLIALVPGTLLYCILFSWGVLINLLIAIFFALSCEAIILILRKRPIFPTMGDLSTLLAAWLFALTLPPILPWWMIAIGIVFAILVAKHLYGGLGYNPFNPAMAGYALLLISFPRELTSWLPPRSIAENLPSFTQIINSVFDAAPIDTFTMATPLDAVKTQISQNGTISQLIESPLFGQFAGSGWEWVNICWLLGGIWLIYRKTISWHIPITLICTLSGISLIFFSYDSETYLSPLLHIFSGATLLGAFFIATDPVTAPASIGGKVIFAIGVGVLIYVIRSWGGYPDAVAFAVLLMNMAAPTIDYFYRPRVFGQQ